MGEHQPSDNVHGDEQKGFDRANKLVVKQLTAKLAQDPAFDLSGVLRQLATTYPNTRKALGDAARKETKVTPISIPESLPPKEPPNPFLIEGEVHVEYPFKDDFVNGIMSATALSPDSGTPGLSDNVGDGMIVALNRAISKGELLWQLESTCVLALGPELAVKIGRSIDISFIHTLQLIKEKYPELAAPDVFGVLKSERKIYVFMSRAKGVSLDRIWCELSNSHKSSIQSQLNAIFGRIRKIPHTKIFPGGELGGGQVPRCKDVRRDVRLAPNALRDETEFNNFLCTVQERSTTPWIRMVRSFMKDDHQIVVTHGDLHPRNIMVAWDDMSDGSELKLPTSDICITSIVDWECSGCYPAYWEFVKALNTIGPKDKFSDWSEFLPTEAIGTWAFEYAIDFLLSRWLG